VGRAVSGGHGDLQGAGAPGPRPITAVRSPTPLCPSYARPFVLPTLHFEADFPAEAYEAALRDCAEGAAWFGVSGLPTIILNEKLSLVGAVPTERYHLLIDWILAGEPGGVIYSEGATSQARPQGATAPSDSSPPRRIAAAKPPREPRLLERVPGDEAGWSPVDTRQASQ
jgi:hypothetical protein